MEKLDVEIEVLKCKIQEENLQEDFKEKLEEKLNNVCNTKDYITMEDIKKKKILTRPYFYQKAAAAFACFIMFSSCAFAGGVGDWIKEMFSNVDQNLEVAYENGDVKEIETEYQTYDGVSVKVDYISLKDNELYMVFNVKTEEEYSRISISELVIEDEQGKVLFNTAGKKPDQGNTKTKTINKKNKLIFLTISENYEDFKSVNMFNIKITNIKISYGSTINEVNGNWNFEIKL